MLKKIVILVVLSSILSGCATTRDQFVSDTLEGAANNAESRCERQHQRMENCSQFEKGDVESDVVAGFLGAILKSLFREN